jgi:L-lactate dehydrogenase complex protein LldE
MISPDRIPDFSRCVNTKAADMKVALFITCLTDSFYPRAGIAVVKVLEDLGCQVEFPAGQTCCGQPMYNNGMHDDARELARKMIGEFAACEHVVTPSGSCAAMVREYYPDLFDRGSSARAAAVAMADKTYEFVEFLSRVLKVDLASWGVKWPGSATYHYSCHLRGLGQTDEAERVIRAVGGLEYRPLEKKEQCCGFGGTFATKFPSISGALVRDKVECIRASGAETLICNDAGCAMNISGACRREGAPVRLISLAEVVAEGLGLLPTEAES